MSELTKYQKFKISRINRSNIKEASYNPRIISQENEEKLNSILNKYGLVETLVWNKRTGNLISGHQRLKQIDSMEKSKNYDIDISEIDVSEEDEIKLNIILNNPSLMGKYDKDKLKILYQTFPEIDFQNDIGFTQKDMQFFDFKVFESENTNNNIEKIENDLQDNNKKNNIDKSITIYFDDNNSKWEFMRLINRNESEKTLKYDDFIDIIKDEYRL